VAIFSSFVASVYGSKLKTIEVGKKIPISFYLGPMALLIIIFTTCFALYFQNPISIFSTDAKTGLFGMFSSW